MTEVSTWLANTEKQKTYPQFTHDITVDVAIIGGGLTGITTAYLLNKAGKKTAVIEKETSARSSVTAYTTAFLTHAIDTSLVDLEKMFGTKKAKKVWQSHMQAIDVIEKIIHDEHISCDFMRCPQYEYITDKKDEKTMNEEADLAQKMGFSTVSYETGNALPFDNAGYLVYADQGKFHPLKYLQQLTTIAEEQGVQIYEKTEATKIHGDTPVTVETPQGNITAQYVIIATYDPFNHPIELFAKKGMYTSYVIEAAIPHDALEEALYLDIMSPYHYFRVDRGSHGDRLIVGGEDHRQEIPIDENKNYAALEEFMHTILPDKKYTITRHWSGPILEPVDGLAYIGKLAHDNHLAAMAFSGNGMTYAHIAAALFTDIILGKTNAYEELYNPERIPSIKQLFQKGTDYTSELFGGAAKNIFHSK